MVFDKCMKKCMDGRTLMRSILFALRIPTSVVANFLLSIIELLTTKKYNVKDPLSSSCS